MTSQRAEDFVNDHPKLSLGVWRVFGVIRGAPTRENHGWGDREAPLVRTKAKEVRAQSSANWKGYTERWHLKADGGLYLDAIVYDDKAIPPLVANERVVGDFHVVLKSEFHGPRQYVPFVDGSIVLDESRWLHERYTGPRPVDTAMATGKHPDFPGKARLWYEIEFPPDTTRM